MNRLVATGFCLLFLLSNAAAASSCTDAESKRALADVGSLPSEPGWPDTLYRAFQKYSRCDEGSVAEGFSDAVVAGLARHWDKVPVLIALADQDEPFFRFVLKHVDSGADSKVLKTLSQKSKTECPKGQQAFCSKLRHAIQMAQIDQ